MTIQFYTNPHSRGQIARWALHEAGADYEQHIIAYGPEMKSEAYRAINPMGKVPAIVDDGRIVTEVAAICAYLADRFPGAGLGPDEHDRAPYYRWLFFAAGPLESAISNHAMGFEPSAEQQRMAGYGSYEEAVSVLERHLSQSEYVAGERFTMADVYVGSHVSWGIQFGTLPDRPAFRAYSERLVSRPAYREAKAVDEKLAEQA